MDPRGRRILILGDSLSSTSTSPGGVLGAELRARGAAAVVVNGRVSRSAVNLWDGSNGENGAAVIAPLAAARPDVVVVFLGTNDAATGVSPAKDEAGFRRIAAAFAAGTEFWVIGAPAFPTRPAIAARVPAVYETQVRVFGAARVIDARPLTPTAGRTDDGVHFTAAGAAPFGRALADALTRAPAPAAGSAMPAISSRAWGWTIGGVVAAAVAVGVATVIRRRRQLAGPAEGEDTALAPGIPATMRTAQLALERMGWQLVNVEIDQVKGTARVEVKRDDGRYVTLDTRNGRTTITREYTDRVDEFVGRRGDRFRTHRDNMRLLGRDRIEGGLRAGLKALAHYLDDNTTGPRLGRDALAKLLRAPADDGLGRRHYRQLAGPNADALPDEEREHVHSPILGEIDEAVERAIAAGAAAPLKYMGAGAEGVVFCDPTGKAYKVGRRMGRGDTSLETEAAFFRKANQVPAIARNVARFYRYDRAQDVIVRECIREEQTKKGNRRYMPNADTKAWDTAEQIHRAMLPFGFTGPERKPDSFVYVRGRGMVLVDGGFAHKVGHELVKDVLAKKAGRIPRGPFEDDEALASHVRWERDRTIPKAIADRLRAKLGDNEPLAGPAAEIEAIARDVRTAMARCGYGGGRCADASRETAARLRAAGYDAEVVNGSFTVNGRPSPHHWVDVGNGTIVDPTVDQFQIGFDEPLPDVLVAPAADWPQYRAGGVPLAAPRIDVIEDAHEWADVDPTLVVRKYVVEDEDEIDGVELRSREPGSAMAAMAHRTTKPHKGDKWQVTWFYEGRPTGDARAETLLDALTDHADPYEYEIATVHTKPSRQRLRGVRRVA